VKLGVTHKAGEADFKAPAMRQHRRNVRAGVAAE
jgi:hypothetical protein